MIGNAGGDAELQARLASELSDLVRKLPHDIRAESDGALLEAAVSGNIPSLITQAGAYLSARLAAEKVQSDALPTA
jgi:hypothetical protein